jgi:hypothetical protein
MTEPIFDHERLDVYRLSIEVQRTEAAAEDRIEYEYRDAEYEPSAES